MNEEPSYPECDYLISDVDKFVTNMDGWDIWFADATSSVEKFMFAIHHEPELEAAEPRRMYTVHWMKLNESAMLGNYAGKRKLPDPVRDYMNAYLKLIS